MHAINLKEVLQEVLSLENYRAYLSSLEIIEKVTNSPSSNNDWECHEDIYFRFGCRVLSLCTIRIDHTSSQESGCWCRFVTEAYGRAAEESVWVWFAPQTIIFAEKVDWFNHGGNNYTFYTKAPFETLLLDLALNWEEWNKKVLSGVVGCGELSRQEELVFVTRYEVEDRRQKSYERSLKKQPTQN